MHFSLLIKSMQGKKVPTFRLMAPTVGLLLSVLNRTALLFAGQNGCFGEVDDDELDLCCCILQVCH